VILLTAVALGLLAGLLRARRSQTAWQLPELQHVWIVALCFVPQLVAFYLPITRTILTTPAAAACLITSQVGLLLFCLINRRILGVPILATGLLLNLLAILANGGLMPLSTETAARLVPPQVLASMKVGSRVSASSKDILLKPEAIVFPWLSDRFVPPNWFPSHFAFSLGDVLIGLGAFMLLSWPPKIGLSSIERKL
jgi:hypothetical protein